MVDPVLIGIRDYNLGSAFPYEYDDWSELDQKNYENGRLIAAEGKTTIIIHALSKRKDYRKSSALTAAKLSTVQF